MKTRFRWMGNALLVLSFGAPAWAWTPLGEGEKGKLEAEIRLMLWAFSAGRDTVPSGTPAQTGEVRDFSIRRARLLFRAQAFPKLEIFTQFGQDNIASKTMTAEPGIRVKDLYLNYKFRDGLQLALGQFRIPFLRQNLESAFNQLLVDRAALTALRPAREGSRDVGGMVWGNFGGSQYRAALFDGSDQESANSRSSLRGTGRLSHNWFSVEPEFGFTGTTLGQKRVLQMGAQADIQKARLDPKDDGGFSALSRDYQAWAADLFYDQPIGRRWALTFEGARLARRDDYLESSVETRSVRGFYAQAGLLLPAPAGGGRLQLAARYERLAVERGSTSSDKVNRSLGFTCFLKGHDRKFQADYTARREEPAQADNDELRLSLVVVF